MQNTAVTIFGCIISLLAVIFIGGLPLHYRSELGKARKRAEQQFQSFRTSAMVGSPVLDGSSAQILDRSESYTSHNGRVHDYVLTLFVLTPKGQHFLFKSNENGSPYVSLLSPDRARIVLKSKYREVVPSDA